MIGLIFGRIGAGKTTLVRHLIGKRRRILYVDPFPTPAGVRAVYNWDDVAAIDWNAPDLIVHWAFEVDWEFFCGLANFLVIMDEADSYWSGSQIWGYERQFFTHSRHYGIDIICITQRPYQTPRQVRSICARMYCLALTDEADIRYVKKSFGVVPPQANFEYTFWHAH